MHILVLNRWPQFPGSRRWDNSLADYPSLIEHGRHRVSYVCTDSGLKGLKTEDAASVGKIEDFADLDTLVKIVEGIIGEAGAVDRIIAFSEFLLDTAAFLRERFDIAGPRQVEVSRFRDKIVMKERLGAAGIRVPRWWCFVDRESFLQAADDVRLPAIFKPIRGASSQNVVKIEKRTELERFSGIADLGSYELEEFIDGELYHIDGVVDAEGNAIFACVSQYITPCLNFEHGAPLGSVVLTRAEDEERFFDFARGVLSCLQLTSSAFHLEVFDRAGELIFLEIGARVPGADVSYVVEDVFGINLFQLWVDVVLEQRTGPVTSPSHGSGGWLIFPRPKPLPCRVEEPCSLLGEVPGLYREFVPEVGEVLRESEGYANLQSGRFLFRGANPESVFESIHLAMKKFSLSTTTEQVSDPDLNRRKVMSKPSRSEILAMKSVVFAEGCFGVFTSKIAASYLRYRPDNCVAVVDSTKKGQTVADVVGYAAHVPIVGSISDALSLGAEVLIIGKGLHSAQLPEDWKDEFLAAMNAGMHVISCIHYRLSKDPVFAACADKNGVIIWETKEPPVLELNKARVLDLDAFVIHTCGSDSNIGKKTTALQIVQEANARNIKTGFAGTGQSGMMITGHGIAIDGVPSDFVAGAVEKVVLDAAEGNEWVVLEGQGSLNHIGASGIALALLHGGLPHALIFCHRMGLERTKVWNTKLLPISELIRLNEELTIFERPARVHAVSLNSVGFDEVEFKAEVARLEKETGLPVIDPCREGAGRLVDILQNFCEQKVAAE